MAGSQKAASTDLHVGICGAGIGGLLAAIAAARAGARVTVLEAATELGEIGAGIQMTPNVARVSIAYGVDKVIGDNLVSHQELHLRRKYGTRVGYTPVSRIEKTLGQPWWVVHRHHLHHGLVEVARRNGCKILISARVANIEHHCAGLVSVQTEEGQRYEFDLLVGADGINSIVRRTLFPSVKPVPPTTNCAYRAIVPYERIRQDSIASELIQDGLNMNVWMAPRAYIITYPISGGKDFNLVLSHHRPWPVSTVEEVDMQELRDEYKDFDPRIKRIVDMIPTAQRWPLLVTGPLESWSSPAKNVVLMGDAAHSMVNHMAQGAATSMEDGAFLGRCLREVIHGRMSLADAVSLYEKERMPKAYLKQQVSFLNGAIWMLSGAAAEARDRAMEPELRVLEIWGYDAEAHADKAIEAYYKGREATDERTKVTKTQADKYVNWFLPEEQKFLVQSKLSNFSQGIMGGSSTFRNYRDSTKG